METDTFTLRDGRVVTILPMNLVRYIKLKDLLVSFLMRAIEAGELNTFLATAQQFTGQIENLRSRPGEFTAAGTEAFKLIARLLQSATADDILDLIQAATGFQDRDALSEGFRLPLLAEALKPLLRDDMAEVIKLVGEILGSLGPEASTPAAS